MRSRWTKLLTQDRHGGLTVLGKIFRSGPPLASLTAVFFLLVSVFAIVGMMLFGQSLGPLAAGSAPLLQMYNFGNFARAWLTVFQISSGDQWMSIMWSVMQLSWVRVCQEPCHHLQLRLLVLAEP